MTKLLQNKQALVTGASRGIGAAIAEAYAKEGCNLVLTCSNSFDTLKELADRLQQEYAIRCIPVQADMSSESDVHRVFEQFTRLDILVNNAGIAHMGLLQDMTGEEWRRVLGVNLDSCFYTAKLAIPMMLHNHAGKIISISSVWGSAGASVEVAYSASKGGINAFTRALAKELAPSGISVNAIACGVIDTRMNACFDETERAELEDEIPMGRYGSPEEVAALAWQLASGPAYLTGQIVTIDGGWV